ncbi:MAG: prolipoprotein diacylglyceryl transferase [Bryobacteraceae bacterium]|nr:prolipoprotein diacylglyceryl transferase [Bryobacteraceae bacterium]
MPHVHLIFESLAYLIAGQAFWWQRRRMGDALDVPNRWLVAGAAVLGASIGSRLLAAFEGPPWTWWTPEALSGKTLVGALLGGLIAVEAAKWAVGIRRSTGDLYAVPLCLGIAVGRIGCFLTGLPDQTHGSPTSLPWGHNYGDGIRRHPAQLYEIAFVSLLAVFLRRTRGANWRLREGDEFKLFLASYLAFRLAIDFLKPGFPVAGLTAVQWICVAGVLYYGRDIQRWLTAPGPTSSTTPVSPSAPSVSAK